MAQSLLLFPVQPFLATTLVSIHSTQNSTERSIRSKDPQETVRMLLQPLSWAVGPCQDSVSDLSLRPGFCAN